MRILIVGYGRMGRGIEKAALERGHEVLLKIDVDNLDQLKSDLIKKADVALEFSTPETAADNIIACIDAGLPVVCGTTGWTDNLSVVETHCREAGGTFLFASNFSIGVNIMFQINRWLAEVMNRFPEFRPSISEIHHVHKKDAPSGTAVTLAGDITRNIVALKSWKNDRSDDPGILSVISERTGEVPGTHTLTYQSPLETLEITHKAHDRSVFASGAVMAAEFIKERTGIFRMEDLLRI